ncbi:MAG: sulfatase-like hydrolase/transferase, partial [Pirellulaceae bacterium]|nr:sulfatase-like hydrolase/transferase [Pirellulaceae bacterium]
MVDDMGYGDPQCFNSKSKIATPHINSLARDGVEFSDAHAPGPLCHMSRYGLMTGRYPFRTDVSAWRRRPLIDAGRTTIASLAKSRGYRTAMVGKWHLGFREDGYDKPLPGGPVDCGFHSYFGIRASTDIPPYFYIRDDRAVQPPTERIEANRSAGWSPIQGAFWRAGGIAPNLKLDDVLPRFTDEAIQVIEKHAANKQDARPLMLYLAYPAPHTPWLPAEEFVGQSGAGMYGDFLMMVDAQIGRVLASLRQAGMERNTLLVFTSDNGPVWFEADVERLKHDSVGGLRGMKSDAWEGGHRMPFIVRWPERVKAGGQSKQLVCFTDLLATFAEVWGVKLAPAAGPDSFSFLPALTGQEATTPARAQFVMRAGSVRSMMTIRSGDWKLITGLGSGGFSKPNRIKPGPDDPAGQLYNLAADLGETTNLYKKHPDVVARLTAELRKIVDGGRSRVATNVDPSTLRGKVMVGYQGWFNCEGDGSNLGWTHWARNRNRPFGPGNVTVDLWPDVSELDSDERYTTGFQHADGSPGQVFSSANRKTVLRHFRWM